MTVKSRHCYVKVTSSSYVPSQLIHELLGSPFVLPSNCEYVAFPLVFWVRCGLIVSIPNLCTLIYFDGEQKKKNPLIV